MVQLEPGIAKFSLCIQSFDGAAAWGFTEVDLVHGEDKPDDDSGSPWSSSPCTNQGVTLLFSAPNIFWYVCPCTLVLKLKACLILNHNHLMAATPNAAGINGPQAPQNPPIFDDVGRANDYAMELHFEMHSKLSFLYFNYRSHLIRQCAANPRPRGGHSRSLQISPCKCPRRPR